ncbi:MAG: DNA polymerase III subunit beta [Phycisphaerales bacterium]|nr:DNA polymerase III subunit beta [Phycisphaerales bacterium]MDG1979418.1 DNA polymerase III subunit beta [Phycisphaerales bacterium]MDG2134020.1 DNA polymerase III subunit beta [Phycisphaerales bacterium]
MKLVCSRDALAEALAIAGSVVISRTPAPVLLCLKLEAKDGLLHISATDTEIGLLLGVAEVDVREEGVALIPADKLNQIVRASSDDSLSIEVSKNIATITGRDSKFKVFGFDPEEFPGVPTFEDEHEFEMGAGTLRRLIGRTVFATAVENSRYAINGVLIERTGRNLRLVATDGRRLAVARGECVTSAEEDLTSIVPTKALNVLNRLMNDPDEPVRVRRDRNQILFQVGSGPAAPVLSSNLVEGSFPPFEDVIPKDQDKKVNFKTVELASAVRRAALLTNEESKGVRLAFAEDGLTLSSRAPEMGEAEIKVESEAYAGDPIEIGFNPSYLTEGLKHADSETILIELKAPNKPGVIKVGGDFTYVVMPVNLG